MPQLAQNPKILAKLKKNFPFTLQRPERKEYPVRETIKHKVYSESPLHDIELNHMRNHAEDREWLRAHLRPRLWQKLVSEVNYWKPHYEMPDIQ